MAVLPKQSAYLMQSLLNYQWHFSQKKNLYITMKDLELPQQCWKKKKKKEQIRSHNIARLQALLECYSNQNSMVLAQRHMQQ